jgi:transitional endoplasmic reticulum ATPase
MKLTVKQMKEKDATRRLAAIDRVAADELDLSGGDFVWLYNDGDAALARVWPGYPTDDGTGVVRIDGHLCSEAGVEFDDKVLIEKADLQPAESLTIALPQRLGVRGNINSLIRREFGGKPVKQGQTIRLSPEDRFGDGLSQTVLLKIASTVPSETVVITDATQVSVSKKPSEQIDETTTGTTSDTGIGLPDNTNGNIVESENDEQAQQGFAQWLIYMIRVSGIEINQLVEESGMSRDRICRLIGGEILPTSTDVASLSTAIERLEDSE